MLKFQQIERSCVPKVRTIQERVDNVMKLFFFFSYKLSHLHKLIRRERELFIWKRNMELHPLLRRVPDEVWGIIFSNFPIYPDLITTLPLVCRKFSELLSRENAIIWRLISRDVSCARYYSLIRIKFVLLNYLI
jgi:hypothetical protein